MRDAHGSPAGTLVVLVDDGTELVVGHMGPGRPDLACVERVARLHLAARRCGWTLVVRDPHPMLAGLLELVGLGGLVGLEPVGQPELREELGVDEVVQPGDRPV